MIISRVFPSFPINLQAKSVYEVETRLNTLKTQYADAKKELAKIACNVRMGIIEGTFNAKSGHPGGSLSIADILTYLYFKEMNVDASAPVKADRDRFVLSKGHCAPMLYSVLAKLQTNYLSISVPSPFAGGAGTAGLNSIYMMLLYQQQNT